MSVTEGEYVETAWIPRCSRPSFDLGYSVRKCRSINTRNMALVHEIVQRRAALLCCSAASQVTPMCRAGLTIIIEFCFVGRGCESIAMIEQIGSGIRGAEAFDFHIKAIEVWRIYEVACFISRW